jgi:hypothetical protein
MPNYNIIGVYRIEPTLASILEAVQYHHCEYLLDDQGNFTDEIYWDNVENLTLVEIQVDGHLSLEDLNHGVQNDQAPYMEYYLDESGESVLTEKEAVEAINPRVCFFLHFTDPAKPIRFGDQFRSLPSVTQLPERLRPFTHYLPVD